jgi:ribosomal protein S18 acetylase RimI-like enzyme
MTDLSIRRFRPDDRERVLELHEEALRDADAYAEGAPDPDLQDVQSHYLDAGGELLVGETDGQIVAIGAFRSVSGRTARAFDGIDAPTAELDLMRVAPAHQRRGDGQRLYDELEQRAREEGFAELVLDVRADHGAIRQFYESHGFAVERRVEIETVGETLDTVFYRKSLE